MRGSHFLVYVFDLLFYISPDIYEVEVNGNELFVMAFNMSLPLCAGVQKVQHISCLLKGTPLRSGRVTHLKIISSKTCFCCCRCV